MTDVDMSSFLPNFLSLVSSRIMMRNGYGRRMYLFWLSQSDILMELEIIYYYVFGYIFRRRVEKTSFSCDLES